MAQSSRRFIFPISFGGSCLLSAQADADGVPLFYFFYFQSVKTAAANAEYRSVNAVCY